MFASSLVAIARLAGDIFKKKYLQLIFCTNFFHNYIIPITLIKNLLMHFFIWRIFSKNLILKCEKIRGTYIK